MGTTGVNEYHTNHPQPVFHHPHSFRTRLLPLHGMIFRSVAIHAKPTWSGMGESGRGLSVVQRLGTSSFGKLRPPAAHAGGTLETCRHMSSERPYAFCNSSSKSCCTTSIFAVPLVLSRMICPHLASAALTCPS